MTDYSKERSRLEGEKDQLLHELQERVKELTALHEAARLLQREDGSNEVLFQELVELLLSALEQTEIAGARISFGGATYVTSEFPDGGLAQSVTFTTAGGRQGLVEVAYRRSLPGRAEEVFLPEESALLGSVTEMLKLYLDRAEAKQRVEDISEELRQRNRELWSLQQELGRVEQRAALGWMTGAIAHELGTPLNSVLGYTQLLAQEKLPEKARRYIDTISSQVRRIAGIVQYYLDRTRGSTSERSPVNMNELIGETLVWLRPVFPDGKIRVITDLHPLPLVNAHAGSLQRVLINLLNNAAGSIRDEGEITIKTGTMPASEHQRAGIRIEVKDTGSGIPADVLPRVFDLFMTTRPQGGGTGLGLAVSQEIVKEHGGKITISSQLEHGTTVTVFLPAGTQISEDS
jgi:signal transduction histidine kinase